MRRFIEFVLANPIVLFVLVAWIAGMVGNVVKAANKRKTQAEVQRRLPSAPVRAAPPRDATGPRSAEEIAAEMRRILGTEQPQRRPARTSQPSVASKPVERPARRSVVEPERPPTIVLPSTQSRRLELHAESHVGEGIEGRHLADTQRKHRRSKRGEIGSLGGRVHGVKPPRLTAHRFAIEDLKKAIVINEILGPPLALRSPDQSRVL